MAEGFDTNRFQSLAIVEGFTCCICLGVLKDPKQCENNEHYFCSGCIKTHLETSHSCPMCQDKLTLETLRKAPRIVEETVSRLKIKCDHAARGCEEVVELGALQAHLENCDFKPVSCSNQGCDEVVNKRDVRQHELNLCRFKTTTCDDCGKKMPEKKYSAHGCVLRREMDEIKSAQHEMLKKMRAGLAGLQGVTTAIENLEKSQRNVSNLVNTMNTDIVLIAGMGAKTRKVLSSVKRFNLFSQTWTLVPELKQARYAAAAVVFENQIIVCGGADDDGGPLDSIEVLDMNGNPTEWQKFAVNLPVPLRGHKCVVYGNRLLIFGGTTSGKEILDTIYELLLVPPYSSKMLCHMKKSRAYHAVELFDDKVLIAGGEDAESDVEVFDIPTNECTEMPPLISPHWGMATVRRDDTMLLIGGLDKERNPSNKITEYDFKTGQNKVQLVMENLRGTLPAPVYHGNTLVVIGGDREDSTSVDCFNFSSNSWMKLAPLSEGRYAASAVVVNRGNFEF